MTTPHSTNAIDTLSLITEASWVAKIVLLLLLASSIVCWAIIFTKWRAMRAAFNSNSDFLDIFKTGKSIEDVFSKSDRLPTSPISTIFHQGIRELRLISGTESSGLSHFEKVDNIQRALLRASTQEVSSLEKNLGWLATTASAAPFIGLFGTVWGIMNAFQSIGASGAANLAVVAPGISEALITTATWIAAAIPAVVAYNYFTGQIRRIAVEMECFSQDLMNIIQRNFSTSKKGN
jgi:biopolymer transport protein TolQ